METTIYYFFLRDVRIRKKTRTEEYDGLTPCNLQTGFVPLPANKCTRPAVGWQAQVPNGRCVRNYELKEISYTRLAA